MRQKTIHRQSYLLHNAFTFVILALTTITSVHAASDIIVTRPHSSFSGMSANFYLGANFGSAQYDAADDSSAAFGLLGGYQINEVLAIEFGWSDLGEASQGSSKSEVSVLQVGLLGKLPIKTNISLFGKAGLARWDYDLSTTTLSGSDSDVDVYFGIGADYRIDSRSTIRFSADFYSMKPTISNVPLSKEKISLISIGYLFTL